MLSRSPRIGVHMWPGGTPSYAAWRQAVLDAEAMGVDAVFGYDHFHKPFVEIVDGAPELFPEQPDVNNFEAWTALASWGEITTRVDIGLLVTAIGFRNPDLLADMARTVDHISGGRLILGLGTGWYPKDYTVYGYDYPSVAERFRQFAEGLERIKNRLAQLKPAPVRDIPILIGGAGERKTLPLVGRYADIWHSFEPLEEFRRKDDLVKRHAADAGRDESAIERSVAWFGPAVADDYHRAGVSLFTTEIHPTDDGYDLGILKEMIAWRDGHST
jgi:probable F420-dependent oxidoreductase